MKQVELDAHVARLAALAEWTRQTLGDAEIARRTKAREARWRAERAQRGKAQGTHETKGQRAIRAALDERACDPEPSERDRVAHQAWGMREEQRRATLRHWRD